MAPRKGGGGGNVEQRSDTLTAVVMADTFTQRFRPVTLERPKVQLPLANACMIDYTLEWLAASGVQEAWVFACAHANQIKRHLADAKWIRQSDNDNDDDGMAGGADRGMKVRVLVSGNCLSLGEALRRIDTEDIIASDFVLVGGDCVANMRLKDVVDAHKARREKNKNAIMTMVFQQASSALARDRLGDQQLVVLRDACNGRLLQYVEVDRQRLRSNDVAIEAHHFSERDDLQVHCNLIDASIYICAPEVLMLFSDNFDYQNIRKDFVAGVLSEEELGNELYTHVLQGGEYATWVRNMRGYEAVTADVLQRWAYPYVPDSNTVPHAEGRSCFQLFRRNMTREMVRVKRHTNLHRRSCIGDGTRLDAGAHVENSVIGRNCVIGAGTRVVNSTLMDGVEVGEGASVSYAMLCSDSRVGPRAVVAQGCILSFGCVVDAGHHVPPHTRVSTHQQVAGTVDLSDDELEYSVAGDFGGEEGSEDGVAGAAGTPPMPGTPQAAPYDREAVGAAGVGYTWRIDESDEGTSLSLPPPRGAAIFEEAAAPEATAAVGETAAADAGAGPAAPAMRAAAEDNVATVGDSVFRNEVAETLLRGLREGISVENLALELNSLKLAEVREFSDCAECMLASLLDLCLPAPAWCKGESASLFPTADVDTRGDAGRVELLKRLKAQLARWGGLLGRFIKDEDDQVNLLLSLEEYCSEAEGNGPKFTTVFKQVFQLLYEYDIVSEEAFLQWAQEKANADASERAYLSLAQPFITWLQEADEDSEEEDSEEE